MHSGRTMGKYTLAFVAFDSAKEKHAVAIADDGRDGEVRYLGEIVIAARGGNAFGRQLVTRRRPQRTISKQTGPREIGAKLP
jgi:hypothetical protein